MLQKKVQYKKRRSHTGQILYPYYLTYKLVYVWMVIAEII